MLKFKHLFLKSKQIVTIVSDLDRENLTLSCQFTICNPKDRYVRKEGNAIAFDRLQKDPIIIKISETDKIEHNWLTWLTLSAILSKIIFEDLNYSAFYLLVDKYRFYKKCALLK